MVLDSIITCPHCGVSKTETEPTDTCRFFYECTGCGELLQPKPGDCCGRIGRAGDCRHD